MISFRPVLCLAAALGFAGCAMIEDAGVGDGTLRPAPGRIPPERIAAPNPGARQTNAPSIESRYAIMIDAVDGATLYEKNADIPWPVASTQKLLAAMVIRDLGNLDKNVTITETDASVGGTRAGLRPGETYTRRELLEVMLVPSGNDAAAALARDAAGSEAAFAELMNQKAAMLGASNSHFANAHGLPARQRSTARDMARIAYYANQDAFIRRTASRPSIRLRRPDGTSEQLWNTNQLILGRGLGTGLKAGYSLPSGRCLVSTADDGRREVIVVQLNGDSENIFRDAEELMAWSLQVPSRFLMEGAVPAGPMQVR